ncbi:alpha/beta hydrolase [Stieleria sp. JC731]|uniref:alpha/beta hydrolase n=1 Tax=Pirellulaceae TaxID=2691357 RepID=UPI001E601C8C|nr:alpha/beta hydrolase [Stieleria sp. JC731]MCC9599384.1 alpha/beta hydrolase [Stieleria sp. JC731]
MTKVSAEQFTVKRESDVEFEKVAPEFQGHAGLCDVYLPRQTNAEAAQSENHNAKSHPVVLVVHGGGWMTGDKWTMYRHANELAKCGIAAVSINYRLAPKSKFPDQVDDVRTALVWIAEHAKEHHFDLNRVGLYGYSAGGHLVSLVATLADESWERVRHTTNWEEKDPRWQKLPKIQAVCAGGPPTDFRNMPPDSQALSYFLGGSRNEKPETYIAASPICFASSADPCFKIIHGEEDVLVALSNATDFHQALIDAKVDCSLQTMPGKGHLMAFFSPTLTDGLVRFFTHQFEIENESGTSVAPAKIDG